MEAIILAGGFGTRLCEVVSDVPKPMAPIAGRPFLEILLTSLSRKGFTRAILALGYKSEIIISHFGNRFAKMAIDYVVEDQPLGTGGAVRLAINKVTQDHIFIFNGDTYLDLEASVVEQSWKQSSNPKIVGCQVPDTARYGRLVVDKTRVVGFSEKGVSGPGLINAGCYVLPRNALDNFKAGEAFSLETHYLIPHVASERFDLFTTQGKFIDIGVPEDYARAQTELANL
jgi:D-glycero-alpha-D-manno-heptose 1-phosphate guanylyltransferase